MGSAQAKVSQWRQLARSRRDKLMQNRLGAMQSRHEARSHKLIAQSLRLDGVQQEFFMRTLNRLPAPIRAMKAWDIAWGRLGQEPARLFLAIDWATGKLERVWDRLQGRTAKIAIEEQAEATLAGKPRKARRERVRGVDPGIRQIQRRIAQMERRQIQQGARLLELSYQQGLAQERAFNVQMNEAGMGLRLVTAAKLVCGSLGDAGARLEPGAAKEIAA